MGRMQPSPCMGPAGLAVKLLALRRWARMSIACSGLFRFIQQSRACIIRAFISLNRSSCFGSQEEAVGSNVMKAPSSWWGAEDAPKVP